ncbi:MAG: hypothetical protein WD794_09600 [Mycobacteriales bacterium]
MTEPQSIDSNGADAAATSAGQAQPPATPRWVKITGVVLALFVLAVLAKVLIGGGVGGHGPGMHGAFGGLAPPASSGAALATVQAWPGL